MFVFLGWAFSQHGTIGFSGLTHLPKVVYYSGRIRPGFAGAGFIRMRMQSRKQKRSTNILSTAVRILTVLGIAIFVLAFSTSDYSRTAGSRPNTAVINWIRFRNQRVPNMAVTYRTPTPTAIRWYGFGCFRCYAERNNADKRTYFFTDQFTAWYQILVSDWFGTETIFSIPCRRPENRCILRLPATPIRRRRQSE